MMTNDELDALEKQLRGITTGLMEYAPKSCQKVMVDAADALASIRRKLAAEREAHANMASAIAKLEEAVFAERERAEKAEARWWDGNAKYLQQERAAALAEARELRERYAVEYMLLATFNAIDAKTAEEHADKFMEQNFAEAIYIERGTNWQIIRHALIDAFKIAEARATTVAHRADVDRESQG